MEKEELASENAALRAQVALYKEILNSISNGVFFADKTGNITEMNTAAEPILKMLGITADVKSRAQLRYFHSDGVTPFRPEETPMARMVRGETVENLELFLRSVDGVHEAWLQCSGHAVYEQDEAKTLRGVLAIVRDISERKRWEREMEQQLVREKEKNEQLERMRGAMDELSTPILEVWDDVLAVPLIGIIDSRRAAEMMTRVLEAIERRQCRYLILDITGVDVIDTATADRFLKLVTAAEILGVKCVLTGARAVVAATLASIGMDLRGLTTLRNLKHGLFECIRAMEAAPRQSMLKELLPAGPRRE